MDVVKKIRKKEKGVKTEWNKRIVEKNVYRVERRRAGEQTVWNIVQLNKN